MGGFSVVVRSARAERARLGCEPWTIRGWRLSGLSDTAVSGGNTKILDGFRITALRSHETVDYNMSKFHDLTLEIAWWANRIEK